MTSPTTAAAVANVFLEFGSTEPLGTPIDQMKLQKLLFYAHAWHLALYGGPLFDEDIEAWPWGPVVPEIYTQTRQYGRDPVAGKIKQLRFNREANRVSGHWVVPTVEKDELRVFLRNVWDSHKEYSGIQLSNSTHSQGEPWTIVKDAHNGDLSSKPDIPNDIIKAVFDQKYKAIFDQKSDNATT